MPDVPPPFMADALDDTPQLRSVAYLERKAAALLLLTVALVVGAAAYLLYARGVFELKQTLVLTSDDSEGVYVGMDMTFSGFPIGRVQSLSLAPDGNVRIEVAVPEKDAHWLRESSVFTLVKGLVGGTTIKAYSGILQDPPLPDGAERPVLRGDATAELPQLMASAKELLANLAALTASDAALGQTLQQMRALGERVNGDGGALEVLLGTPEHARQTRQMLERANQLLARLDRTVARADQQLLDPQGVVAQLSASVQTLHLLLQDSRRSMRQLDAVLAHAASVGANVDAATTDLEVLRGEVDSNLRNVERMLAELQRKWPFTAPPPKVQLP